MENHGGAESNGDTYHDAGDIQRSPAADTSSPNNHKLGDVEQMLHQEQLPDNNDSTIEPGSQQKPTETADKTNNDPVAEEIRELPSPVVENQSRSSFESADTIDQDSEPQHRTGQQPNQPFPDQQLTENNATETTHTDEGIPLTEVGQLGEKTVQAKKTTLADTDGEGSEFSAVAQESAANLHPYSGDLLEKSDTMDVGFQGLLLQRGHRFDLEPSEEDDTGISRPDRGLPDAPPGYEIAPQIKPPFQQPVDPIVTGRSPAGGTPSTGNDNPDNGHKIPDESPPPDDPSHNADGNAAPQLMSASSTETNNESNGDDHVSPSPSGNGAPASAGAANQEQDEHEGEGGHNNQWTNVEQTRKPTPHINSEEAEKTQNPELGSLTDLEARMFYLKGEEAIKARNQELIAQGVPARDRAIELIRARNDLRTRTRELMADRERAEALDITDPNRTLDELVKRAYRESGLVGDALWDYLAGSASRSRPSVNERFNL